MSQLFGEPKPPLVRRVVRDNIAIAKSLWEAFHQRERLNLQTGLELGGLLCKIKEDCEHGEFGPALEEIGISRTWSHDLRSIAKLSPVTISRCESISDARRLVSQDEPADPPAAEDEFETVRGKEQPCRPQSPSTSTGNRPSSTPAGGSGSNGRSTASANGPSTTSPPPTSQSSAKQPPTLADRLTRAATYLAKVLKQAWKTREAPRQARDRAEDLVGKLLKAAEYYGALPFQQPRKAKCSKCGADITWAVTAKYKWMCLEAAKGQFDIAHGRVTMVTNFDGHFRNHRMACVRDKPTGLKASDL